MKATEQYFSVVLFIMLHKAFATIASVDESYWAVLFCGCCLLCCTRRLQLLHPWMKATEQYFSVVLFIMLYKAFTTIASVDESYWAVLFCGAVYYAVQGVYNYCIRGWKLLSSTFLWCCLLCCTRRLQLLHPWMKATEQYFSVVLFIMLYKAFTTIASVDESYWAVLFCGAVYYAVQGVYNYCIRGWKLLSSTFLWCCLLCCTRRLQLLHLWMKATEQYFSVVLFIMLYRVILTFESV